METKPFDGEEQGALLGRLIGRVGIEICIEMVDSDGLAALWPTRMPFSAAPGELASKDLACPRGKDGS